MHIGDIGGVSEPLCHEFAYMYEAFTRVYLKLDTRDMCCYFLYVQYCTCKIHVVGSFFI